MSPYGSTMARPTKPAVAAVSDRRASIGDRRYSRGAFSDDSGAGVAAI
jgi:hypothetical protein